MLVAALAALTMAACGGDDGEEQGAGGGSGDGSSERATITVGLIPITPVAPVYLGMDQGFFEEENLTVRPQLAQGGAAIVPAAQSGDIQIGFSNSVSLLIAQTRGLPLRVVYPGESSPGSAEEDNTAVMVTKDSSIREPADLAGKTIGVNTLQNIAGLTVEASLDKEGVDTSAIKLVEVPFPEMLSAIESGDVDAGFFNEPFTTLAKRAGARTIINPYAATGEGLPIAPYFATESYAEENADVIERFRRAMDKATRYASENPDEVRRILPTYTEIPEDVVEEIGLPVLTTEVRREGYEQMADLVTRFGYSEERPNVDELLSAMP
jgi:NitT/TauT family transport system substrate-binding protein